MAGASHGGVLSIARTRTHSPAHGFARHASIRRRRNEAHLSGAIPPVRAHRGQTHPRTCHVIRTPPRHSHTATSFAHRHAIRTPPRQTQRHVSLTAASRIAPPVPPPHPASPLPLPQQRTRPRPRTRRGCLQRQRGYCTTRSIKDGLDTWPTARHVPLAVARCAPAVVPVREGARVIKVEGCDNWLAEEGEVHQSVGAAARAS
jgi:hypothetical protein